MNLWCDISITHLSLPSIRRRCSSALILANCWSVFWRCRFRMESIRARCLMLRIWDSKCWKEKRNGKMGIKDLRGESLNKGSIRWGFGNVQCFVPKRGRQFCPQNWNWWNSQIRKSEYKISTHRIHSEEKLKLIQLNVTFKITETISFEILWTISKQ